jgi:hypothetical protein
LHSRSLSLSLSLPLTLSHTLLLSDNYRGPEGFVLVRGITLTIAARVKKKEREKFICSLEQPRLSERETKASTIFVVSRAGTLLKELVVVVWAYNYNCGHEIS